MTSDSTPSAEDMRIIVARAAERPLLRRIYSGQPINGYTLDTSLEIADALLAPDGPIAAMQAEYQRTVERLERMVADLRELREFDRERGASLEAQLSEAKKALTIIEQKSFAALADVRCARSAKETNDVG